MTAKEWLRKTWCGLTGGHYYSFTTLHSHFDEKRNVYTFSNHCQKCGKVDKWEVPADDILPELVRNEVAEDV